MDGTLIDTEKYYRRCWPQAAADCGYHMTDEQALALRSLGRPFSIDRMKEMFGPDADYYQIRGRRMELVKEVIAKEGIQCKEGAKEALTLLKKKGYRLAVSTATDLERTTEYLNIVGLKDYFDELVCATMVKQGKPAPDIYLFGCEKLGVDPKDAIAVEDAPNGVKSAYAAGLNVVMIPDQTQPEDELLPMLYKKVDSLMELAKMMPDVTEKNYKSLYIAGEIPFEAIDDYSYEWGMSDDERTLAQYLGLNAEEEDAWVSIGEEALKELLDKQKR